MFRNKLLPIVFISSLSLFAGQNTTIATKNSTININDLQDKALVKAIKEIEIQKEKIQANQYETQKLKAQISILRNKIDVLERLSRRNHATIIRIKMPAEAKKAPEVSSPVFKIKNNTDGISTLIRGEYAIKTWGANVRQGPGLNYKIIKQFKRGDKIFIANANKNNIWFYVPKYNGWIYHAIVQKVK